ncbi:MAG: DUF4340 domain-containing protein [Candidatus Shapirobacteria bacterium]|jgi:hypothetical protein
MKINLTAISGIILVFLMAVFLGLKYQEQQKTIENSAPYFGEKIENFCFNDLCLMKNELVDNELVENMLKKIRELEIGEMVAENSQNFKKLGFEEDNRVWLKIGDEKIELGRINDNYSGTYVRINEDGPVYLTDIVIDKSEVAKEEYWRKKWLTNLSIYQITEVKIKRQGRERVLTVKEGKWPEERLINAVAYLKTTKYLGDKQPSKTLAEIKLTTEKESINLTIGANWGTIDGKNYFEIDSKKILN